MDSKKPVTEVIKEMVSDIPGWSPEDQLYSLYLLSVTTAYLGGDILEIGSWCGRSSTVFATALRHMNVGKLHCVDLFPNLDDWYENPDGSFSFKVTINNKTYGGYNEQTVWKEPFEQQIIPVYKNYGSVLQETFNKVIISKGFSDLIVSYKGTAVEFKEKYNGSLRLAFIDGDHGYEAVCQDIEIVEKYLLPGGWIVFDDAFSVYDGVSRAIEDMIIKSGKYEFGHQLTRKCFAARRKG